MKTQIVRAGMALALVSLSLGIAKAGPPKDAPKMSGDCPVCHMKLSSTKTKDNTVAVKLKKDGPTQYCCSKCKMPASVLVKSATEKKPTTKPSTTKPAPKK